MEGDAERLREVFRTDAKFRDEAWRDRLDAAFWPARLGSFTPHVMRNETDGFLSYRLGGDERDGGEAPGEPAGLVDYALQEDIGLIYWPSEEPQPLWAFSLGDVLSYRLYGTSHAPRFWGEPPDREGAIVLTEREEAKVGSPNDEMFPPIVRHAVRRYLREKLGVREPRVVLVKRPDRGSRLVFELDPEVLGGEAGVEQAFSGIHWRVPSCIPLYRIDSMVGSPAMRPF